MLFKAMPPELVLMRGGANALAIWQQMITMGMPTAGGPEVAGPEGAKGKPGQSQDKMNKDGMSPPAQQPNQPKNPSTGAQNPVPGVQDASKG